MLGCLYIARGNGSTQIGVLGICIRILLMIIVWHYIHYIKAVIFLNDQDVISSIKINYCL